MKNKLLLLDLDGVILNSEELILQERKKNKEKTWDEFFEDIDWKKIYMESKPINNLGEFIKYFYFSKSCVSRWLSYGKLYIRFRREYFEF